MDPITLALIVGAVILLFKGKPPDDTPPPGPDAGGKSKVPKTGPDLRQAGDDGGYAWPLEVDAAPSSVPYEMLVLNLRTFDYYGPDNVQNDYFQDQCSYKTADLQPGSNPSTGLKKLMKVDLLNRNGVIELDLTISGTLKDEYEVVGLKKRIALPPFSELHWQNNGGYGKRTLIDTWKWPTGDTKTLLVLDVTHLDKLDV